MEETEAQEPTPEEIRAMAERLAEWAAAEFEAAMAKAEGLAQ
tara:strand:- start:156 stop:281 length:126 start_codon:yes stop_codon:yes gene_type:complete